MIEILKTRFHEHRERRYGRVFTFHNGADSYYSVRGWRGYLLV